MPRRCVSAAGASDVADAAMRGESGVTGQDEQAGDVLRVCEFPRIKGGKAFDPQQPWFADLLEAIGQPKGQPVQVEH